MGFRKIKLELNMLALCLLIGFSALAQSQNKPLMTTRFANPQFEERSRTYCLDVEIQADKPNLHLFGMNVRFFYDASKLNFLYFDNFQEGYDILDVPPRAYKGNLSSGSEMFDFEESAAYVNGAIQLQTEEEVVEIGYNQWVKFFEVCFEVPKLVDEESFCPSVLWDKQASPYKGGLFKGEDGVVITINEIDPETRQETAPTYVKGLGFNWEYSNQFEMPYGSMVSETCLNLSGFVTGDNWLQADANGYALLQNEPNPFENITKIGFLLPESMEAKLSFFDVSGKLIRVVEGDYAAGKNQVIINRNKLTEPASVLFYRLETAEYTSDMKKMIVIDK